MTFLSQSSKHFHNSPSNMVRSVTVIPCDPGINFCLSSLPIALRKTITMQLERGKGFPHLTVYIWFCKGKPRQEFKLGRNLEIGTQADPWKDIAYWLAPCGDHFLITTWGYLAHSGLDPYLSLINQENSSTDLSTGQSGKSVFSVEVLFPND